MPDTCDARLFLGDDHGDNSCGFRCRLPVGHAGMHEEFFEDPQLPLRPDHPYWEPPKAPGKVRIIWEFDQRYNCPEHGLQSGEQCQVCFEAYWAWERDVCCHECEGFGDVLLGPAMPCAVCRGTGYAHLEQQDAALQGGYRARDKAPRYGS